MRQILEKMYEGETLDYDEAYKVMFDIGEGRGSNEILASILTVYRMRPITATEFSGFRTAMYELSNRLELESERSIDIVGTGGDRAMTVNISSMSAIVMAAAGAVVVKHGNRAASSRSGSADMLEALGVRLDLAPEDVAAVGREAGITFCFAQTFHPSMRHSAVVRKDLGVATAFNFLGPLTNPAQPRYAVVGSADARMAPLLAGVFAARGTQAVVFRGEDGLDEVTPATTTRVWWAPGTGEVQEWSLDPARLGLSLHPVESLRGADAGYNAQVARELFAGATGAVRDAVLLNAGTALALLHAGEESAHPADEAQLHEQVRSGMDRAAAAIDDGGAAAVVDRWVAATRAR